MKKDNIPNVDIEEILHKMQASASSFLEKFNIPSRKEFEVQQRLLEQAMVKLEAVEKRLKSLQGKPARKRKPATKKQVKENN